MPPRERVPPDVEGEAPLTDRQEAPDACVHRQARLFGFVVIVVSAVVTLLLLYAGWQCLKAAGLIAGR